MITVNCRSEKHDEVFFCGTHDAHNAHIWVEVGHHQLTLAVMTKGASSSFPLLLLLSECAQLTALSTVEPAKVQHQSDLLTHLGFFLGLTDSFQAGFFF